MDIRLEWLVSFEIGYSGNWIKLHAAHPPYLFITGEMKNVLNPMFVFNCHHIFFVSQGFCVAADIFVFEPDRFGFDEWFVTCFEEHPNYRRQADIMYSFLSFERAKFNLLIFGEDFTMKKKKRFTTSATPCSLLVHDLVIYLF